MAKGQTGTSTGAKLPVGRLTTDPSRVRRSTGGTSTKARRIAAIPVGPVPDAAAASAETHTGGSPAGESGGSRPASPAPAELPGRVSRRACAEGGTESFVTGGPRAGCPRAGCPRCGATGADRRATDVARDGTAADPRPWNNVGSSSGAALSIPAGTPVENRAGAPERGGAEYGDGSPAVGEKQKPARFDPAAFAGPAPMDWVAPCCVTAQFTTTAEPAIPPFEVEIAVARWTTTDSWRVSWRSSAEPKDAWEAA